MVRAGLPSGQGRIIAIAYNRSILENDFGTTYYVSKLDNDDSWSRDVQAGWYVGPGSVITANRPASDLILLKQDLHKMRDTGEAVRAEITRQSAGHSNSETAQAHNLIYKLYGGSYLIGNNSTLTIAERRAWAPLNAAGPTDITGNTLGEKVANYFTHFSGESATSWISFANPTTGARTTFLSPYVVSGTVPDGVDLTARDWIDGITA